MTITDPQITPLVALIAGILILIVPRLLSFIVAIYLIIVGLEGLNAIHHFIRSVEVTLTANCHPGGSIPLKSAGHNSERKAPSNRTIPWPNRAQKPPVGREKIGHPRLRPAASRKKSGASQVQAQIQAQVTRRLCAVEDTGQGQMGLRFRRRQGAGPRRHAQSARRQGRGPCRNGASRPAGAARLHHHHRGLHLFLQERQNLSEGIEGAGRSRARRGRPHHRQEIRRCRKSAAGLGALRRARLDARHDGHGAQSRPQRRDR